MNPEWTKRRDQLITGMTEYMADGDVGYAQEHVDRCAEIVDAYMASLRALAAPDQVAIMQFVQTAVLQLNELNEVTEGALIETGEREALWELIQTAAVDSGLVTTEEDITEEWREW